MRLTDLEPQFIKYVVKDGGVFYSPVDTLAEADGIDFLCPVCFLKNGGNVGTHMVACWFEGKVADDVTPGPGRWNPTGTGYGDLSFVPGKRSNSVQLTGGGCAAHFHITDGDIKISS
jgi:hypothetical protein